MNVHMTMSDHQPDFPVIRHTARLTDLNGKYIDANLFPEDVVFDAVEMALDPKVDFVGFRVMADGSVMVSTKKITSLDVMGLSCRS